MSNYDRYEWKRRHGWWWVWNIYNEQHRSYNSICKRHPWEESHYQDWYLTWSNKYHTSFKATEFCIPYIPRSYQHYQCLTRNVSELRSFQNYLLEELGHVNYQLDFSDKFFQYFPMDHWYACLWGEGYYVWMCSRRWFW